jgi:hypothetical protein
MLKIAPKINPKLAHLTEQEIIQLIEDYYSGKNITTLKSQYKIELKGNNIVVLFPPQITDSICKNCNINLWKNFEPKKLVNISYWQNISYCPQCGHRNEKSCTCNYCEEHRKLDNINLKGDAIKLLCSYFDTSNLTLHKLENISITEKIYLGTFIQIGLSKDGKYLRIFSSPDYPVAPTKELYFEMVDLLTMNKIILIYPDTFQEELSYHYNPPVLGKQNEAAFYYLNIENNDSLETINSLISPTIDVKANIDEINNLWKKIATEECKSFLEYSLKYVDFPYTVGEKSNEILESLLEYFSISQVFGLIDRCLGYTTKEYQAGKVTKINAGIYLLTTCKMQGKKAIDSGWVLTKYFRPQELPESVLSKFFFNSILNVGKRGLDIVPNLYFLDDY